MHCINNFTEEFRVLDSARPNYFMVRHIDMVRFLQPSVSFIVFM